MFWVYVPTTVKLLTKVTEPLELRFKVKSFILGPESAKLPKEPEPPIDRLDEELPTKKFAFGVKVPFIVKVKFDPIVRDPDERISVLPELICKLLFIETPAALLIVKLTSAGNPLPITCALAPLQIMVPPV